MEFSPYILSVLKGEDKEIYVIKCSKIGVDPYNIPRHKFKDVTTFQEGELPDLAYGNIYSYLINFISYTNKTLQAYKSLDTCKIFYIWMGERNTHH